MILKSSRTLIELWVAFQSRDWSRSIKISAATKNVRKEKQLIQRCWGLPKSSFKVSNRLMTQIWNKFKFTFFCYHSKRIFSMNLLFFWKCLNFLHSLLRPQIGLLINIWRRGKDTRTRSSLRFGPSPRVIFLSLRAKTK